MLFLSNFVIDFRVYIKEIKNIFSDIYSSELKLQMKINTVDDSKVMKRPKRKGTIKGNGTNRIKACICSGFSAYGIV